MFASCWQVDISFPAGLQATPSRRASGSSFRHTPSTTTRSTGDQTRRALCRSDSWTPAPKLSSAKRRASCLSAPARGCAQGAASPWWRPSWRSCGCIRPAPSTCAPRWEIHFERCSNVPSLGPGFRFASCWLMKVLCLVQEPLECRATITLTPKNGVWVLPRLRA